MSRIAGTKPKATTIYLRDQTIYNNLQATIQEKYYVKFGEKLSNGETILRALKLMDEYLDGTLALKRQKTLKDTIGRILE